MMVPFGYYYPNHSALYRRLEAYFRSRGVTSDRKIDKLVWRWVAQKGHREPPVRNADMKGAAQ